MKYMYLLVKCSSNWMTTIFALATLCFDIFVKTKLGSMRDDKTTPDQVRQSNDNINLHGLLCVWKLPKLSEIIKTD